MIRALKARPPPATKTASLRPGGFFFHAEADPILLAVDFDFADQIFLLDVVYAEFATPMRLISE